MNVVIRNETQADHRAVEAITKRAFWNLHVPGCDEHYLTHVLRSHPDFLPDLDFVIEFDGRIIGNIMYAKSKLVDNVGRAYDAITFGPVSIDTDFQRRGFGSMLIEHSIRAAKEAGHKAIIIYGNPGNYVTYGFKSCARYRIADARGRYPTGMLVLELEPGILDGKTFVFEESPAYAVDPSGFDAFDRGFEPMEKRVLPGQELFAILASSLVDKELIGRFGSGEAEAST